MKPEPEAKIGAGHASAMLRQGLREARAALYPNSNVAQNQEYGLYGTLTPGEVAESRRSNELNLEEERPMQGSVLEDRMRQAQSRSAPEREAKDMGLDR